MRKISRAGGISIAAAAVVLITALPSSAGDYIVSRSAGDGGCPSGTASLGSFNPDSETTYVRDNCKDGHAAVLRYRVGAADSQIYYVWASGGLGDENSRANAIGEGRTVRLSACIGETGSGAIAKCDYWRVGQA